VQQLQLIKKILLTISLFTTTVLADSIGDIIEQTGLSAITRNSQKVTTFLEQEILLYDLLNTGNGRLAIEFLDKSNLRLTEHSRVLIDEVIYDPDPSKSKMVMRFAMGTARFTSGMSGNMNKANIDLLDVNFLQDLLAIIEEGDLLSRKRGGAEGFDGVSIEGTAPGFDKDSQYNTMIDDSGQIWFYREVSGIISLKLPITANARIETITDEKESIITVGDGESVSIIITQVN
jgi:hypothetical protein